MFRMATTISQHPDKEHEIQPPKLEAATARGVRDAYFYMQSLVDKIHAANPYWPNRHWSLVMQPDAQRGFAFESDEAVQIDPRAAAWHFFTFYPAIMSDKVGTVYLAPIADSKGQSVAAGKNCRLRIPTNIPAKLFWSLTMYDHATWSFIINPGGRSGTSSLDKDQLQVNDDGSADIYFGPDEPEGHVSNWLPTAGKRPYIWMRLYGPDTPFWEKSFIIPDVELLK